jgi:hypothetical protein
VIVADIISHILESPRNNKASSVRKEACWLEYSFAEIGVAKRLVLTVARVRVRLGELLLYGREGTCVCVAEICISCVMIDGMKEGINPVVQKNGEYQQSHRRRHDR